jgi:cellulose synthase/poly-beta-1,6-N-acetylglucosamine synthase-like glycosyltransferase
MQDLFFVLIAAELLLGLWSLWTGLQWVAMARRHLARHPGFFAPRSALLCPCKGLERGLDENLAALCSQDYPNYEVFFVFARSDDPAYDVVRRVVQASSVPAHIVIAGRPDGCGEKVNNLRFAVEQVDPTFQVYVFADSDGRPGRQWLAHMVAPLSDPQLGAATSFRWWLPDLGGFCGAFGAAWDSSIVTLWGEHSHNFCWGGATAIRRDVFEAAGVRAHWTRSVSDDWTMTSALRAIRRPIQFVPECLVPTLRDATASGLLEFTNRQMIITRVYAPKIWTAAAFVHLLYCATFFVGLWLIVQALISGLLWMPTVMLLLMIMLLAAAKGVLRWVAVSELLPKWKVKLIKYAWAWTVLTPFVPFLYAVNFIVSASTRRITWRGIRYDLVSAAQTRIL